MKYNFQCTFFNGYKPCAPFKICDQCTTSVPFGHKVLIVFFIHPEGPDSSIEIIRRLKDHFKEETNFTFELLVPENFKTQGNEIFKTHFISEWSSLIFSQIKFDTIVICNPEKVAYPLFLDLNATRFLDSTLKSISKPLPEVKKKNEKDKKTLLIINLEALGDVLMTTAQLPEIKKKYPAHQIEWLTLPLAQKLLENNPLIDRIHPFTFHHVSNILLEKYDVVFNADKSQIPAAIANQIQANTKFGFGLNENGQIVPLNHLAHPNFDLGVNDQKKFFDNNRSGQDILSETWGLPWKKAEYVYQCTPKELQQTQLEKRKLQLTSSSPSIGFNIGCSILFPNKSLLVKQQVYLIKKIKTIYPKINILLFGTWKTLKTTI